MTWEDAIKKAIQRYWDQNDTGMKMELDKHDKTKYNKKYFDSFEQQQLDTKPIKKKA